MEGKQRLLQLLAFTTGPAIDVVQQYFELKIIRQGTDFEDYLNDPQNKHKLFHERYPKLPCCRCVPISIAAPSKRGCLGYQQFSKLYNENGTVTAGHEQTNGSQISQHCLCKVSAQKSIRVIDIDLTLLNAIIQHCCSLHITTKVARWMKVIKEVRDTLSHWPEGQLEKNMFDQTWKKLETATLQCAGDIGHSSVKIFQMTIDLITTCSVDDLGKRILQTTDKLSEVHEDINGLIPTVKSILYKQNAICDQLSSQSKDLTEVKTVVSGVNTMVERTKDVMEKVDIKTEESTHDVAKIKEDMGDVKHRLKQIEFMIGMTLQRQGKNQGNNVTGEKKRNLTLDVDATSQDWDEEKTTRNLEDEMQATKERVDNDHYGDTKEFIIEKVENKCIHLELSASPDIFERPQKLRIAIKSLIHQFVKAGKLDGNVPATVNINITVKSALTTEEKTVASTVFSDNDTLNGPDYNEQLQIEQKPRLLVKQQTFEPDQQMVSTSANDSVLKKRKNLAETSSEAPEKDDSVLKKRKNITETLSEAPEKATMALKKTKMSTETETAKELTDKESIKELQEYVIDEEKALQKLGKISLIDWKKREERKRKNKINKFDLEKVSDVVSKATFFSMASSCKSKGQKNSILTQEYLYYIRQRCAIRRFYGGSGAEGTNLEDSDIDKMIVDSNITACENRNQSKNIEGQVFFLDTSVCRPGFARLIPVKLDPNLKTLLNNHGKTINDMLETIEGNKTFLSSDKMVDFWIDFLTKTKTAVTKTETSRHGPSTTATKKDPINSPIKEKLGASLEPDFAFGISLYEWPIDGEEWVSRKRKHGWPSPEFIEKITKLKCHVVAVGDKMSPTSSLEWRVSFLLQERELVWNFNDTQLQCFILMKNILKKFLHPIAPEELSSYHMKTILLWQSENNPQCLWQPKYLLRCISKCLLFLKYCIEKLHLEHYIDRRKNLFSYRFENHILKENMIKCIDKILANIVARVLECVNGVDLLSPWRESKMDVDDFLQLCREKLDFSTKFETFRLPLEYFHKAQSVLGVNVGIVFSDFGLLSEYFESFGDNKPITEIEDSFIEAVRRFINIRIALTLLETIINVQDNQQQQLQKLQKFLEDNQNIDALSGKLYLATYCLRLQNTQKVISIIRSIIDLPSQNLLYIGKCSKCMTIHIGNGTTTQLEGLPNPFEHTKKYLSTAQDVIFSRADLSIVPHALKFECFIERSFLIHPLVYMLYLAVISSECDQEVYMYMNALESTVNECEGSLHNYRNLNILGCSYSHVGDYTKAFECYTKSLMQTVPTGRQTAAVFHLIILMFHVINNGYGGGIYL